MPYAGFWWRFLAYIIDGVLFSVVIFVIMIPFAPDVATTTTMGPDGQMVMNTGPATFATGINLVQVLIGWLYFTVLESSEWQGTIGKKLLGLRVTDMDGNRISFARANGRYWSKIISAIILCIGFIMIAFTEKKQGLHDMIAKTLVLKKVA